MMPDLAPMIVFLALIFTTAGVLILRPISKRLAELLHVMAQERLAPGSAQERRQLEQLRELVNVLESRLELLEERQRFTEALVEPGRAQVGAPAPD